MATVEECRRAIGELAAKMGEADDRARRAAAVERSLSCRVPDLGLTFAGRLSEGAIRDIVTFPDIGPGQPGAPRAQVRLTMSSDDLIALVDGKLDFLSAWAKGRVKFEAGVRDLLRLRSLL
ncbi:MAG: SCP2 sterol-binding domain-containing protein [Streptomycetales bacterium]